MAKSKRQPQRSFSEVLADIRELQDRFGHVRHFLSMVKHLLEAVELDNGTAKTVLEHVKPTYEAAVAAVEAYEGGA